MSTHHPDPEHRPGPNGAEVVNLDALRDRRQAAAVRTDTAPAGDGRDPADVLEGELVMVDQPDRAPARGDFLAELHARRAARRPVLPAWMLSAAEFGQVARWIAGHYLHITAFHAVRTPIYAGKLALRAPRGAWRSLAAAGRWTLDIEGLPVRLAAVRREDAELYLKLSRQRDLRVRWRTLVAASVAGLGTAATVALIMLTPSWAHWAALTGAVLAFGLLGAP